MERAVALGAIDGGSPAAVARASDIVILCVPSSPQVAEVVDAMLPELGAGTVVVDCSTIDPEVERAQHQRVTATGAGFLDAPLSGGTAGAERGTLTLMVGGDAATLETARPALEPFAGLIVHVGGPGMGQVVKLCNNLIYAAQMLATSEATALALTSGVDLAKFLEVLEHSTGDCVAVRTRLPVAGVVPESPASNGWRPGFMTDLMAKDLDLALAYAARCRRAAGHHGHGPPGPDRGHRRPGTAGRTSRRWPRWSSPCPGWRPHRDEPAGAPLPALVLAADHRARGVMTIERYADYVPALRAGPALLRRHTGHAPSRLADLARTGAIGPGQRTYLSLNRTGLAGTAFELDDRLVASVDRAAERRVDRRQAHDPHRPRRPGWGRGPGAAGPGPGGGPVRRARSADRAGAVAWRDGCPATPTTSCWPRSSPTTWAPRCSRCRCPTFPPGRPGSRRWAGWWPVWACRCCSSAVPTTGPATSGCWTRPAT